MGMIIYLLLFQHFNNHVGGLIHVLAFVDVSLLSSYQVARFFLSQWVIDRCLCSSHWHGGSKVHFGEDHAAKECEISPCYGHKSSQWLPSIQRWVQGSFRTKSKPTYTIRDSLEVPTIILKLERFIWWDWVIMVQINLKPQNLSCYIISARKKHDLAQTTCNS